MFIPVFNRYDQTFSVGLLHNILYGMISYMFEQSDNTTKYNRNKHNYWFLLSFSLLSILLHFVCISRDVHNILYSANVFSLIGYTIIALLYPYRLYNYYGETFRNIIQHLGLSRVIQLNVYWLHIFAWIIHAIPVWVLRNTYSMGNPISWILLYFILMGPFLGKIYNLSTRELAGVFFGAGGLLIGGISFRYL